MINENYRREIKSFAGRAGRLSGFQKLIIEQSLNHYGCLWPLDQLNQQGITTLFPLNQPMIMEIGFGTGDNLIELAKSQPYHNFLGIEVYSPGIANVLNAISQFQLSNLRVIKGDAKKVLEQGVGDSSLKAIFLFFPDPCPKKRHHKRRLVNSDFITLVISKLQIGGIFHMATDWQHYADSITKLLNISEQLENLIGQADYNYYLNNRIKTKFEQKGEAKGHQVFDLVFRKS